MQHLNYCRQMTKQFTAMKSVPSLSPEAKRRMDVCLVVAAASEKFILPDGGHLLMDSELRALDADMPLHLPFKVVALEFFVPEGGAASLGKHRSTKRIVFAAQSDEKLMCMSAHYMDHRGTWEPGWRFNIDRMKFLNRNVSGPNGEPRIIFEQDDGIDSDVGIEPSVVLSFINALQCSNVRAELSKGQERGKVKTALPFDDYHILTIGGHTPSVSVGHVGSYRSPREHLRRGHIRRYESGMKVWVNATVVNPGIGGKVSKDYRLAA